VVQAAVGAIQSLGSAETERLALEAARAAWPSVRRAGLRILSYFGWSSGLPLFVAGLRDPDPRVRDAAVQGLPFIDHPDAVEELLKAARDPGERTRAGVMRSLGHCRGDVRVISYLLRGLADPEAWVRYYACQSLGRLGVETAASAIARLLDDAAGQVRVAAIEALSHLRSEAAFAALREAARSNDADVQRAALVGLGISRRPEAEPILLEAVGGPDAATRLVAVSAIADLDSNEVLQALVRAAGDRDEAVRYAAVNFLAGRSGAEPTAALVALLAGLPDKERLVAALALPAEGRIAGLARALETADDELAPHLVSALARMRHADADRVLVEALGGRNVAARKAAAFAVANRATPGGHEALRRLATSDADAGVRRVAALLLAS
jgi:HEAT repeat protein